MHGNVVAEVAVQYEPVSTIKFPADRENNREICRFRPSPGFSAHSWRANSIASTLIPEATEQGIYFTEQGMIQDEQGLLRDGIRGLIVRSAN
jgi:hypothetical protein